MSYRIRFFFFCSFYFFSSWNFNAHGDCDEDDLCGEDSEEYQTKRRAALSLLTGGIVGIAIGIPLLVSGIRGRKRQSYLKRKDEILATLSTVRVGLTFDPSTNSGGLSLSATF